MLNFRHYSLQNEASQPEDEAQVSAAQVSDTRKCYTLAKFFRSSLTASLPSIVVRESVVVGLPKTLLSKATVAGCEEVTLNGL